VSTEVDQAGELGAGGGRIPFALRIGVVGHRAISDPAGVERAARAVLDRLQQRFRGTPSTPVVLVVLSSLAEGADRLLAREVLARPSASLEAILPCPPDEYARDFSNADSAAEFDELLGRAAEVVWPLGARNREDAYELSGRLVVDGVDVVVAVWDGCETASGAGTAPAVVRARDRRIPLFVIDPGDPSAPREEPGAGLPERELAELSHFNRATLTRKQVTSTFARRAGRLHASATPWTSALLAWHLPTFVRADALADRYRRLNTAVSDAVFLLGALALTTVGAQLLFLENAPSAAWVEVVTLLALLAVLLVGRHLQLHPRWVAYRFLAERLRASVFVAAVGARPRREARSQRVFDTDAAERWLKRAFEQAWLERPSITVPPEEFEQVRSFVLDSWVSEQLGYFAASAHRHERRVHRLEVASVALFALTVALATLHSLGVGHAAHTTNSWAKIATLLTIGLPALGVALSGVRTQRDYARNSLRFLRMREHMEVATSRLVNASDMDDLRAVVTDLDADLLDENRDWLLSILIHGRPELGA
jgi:hypothetical protein